MHKLAVIVIAAILCFAGLPPSVWSAGDTATVTVRLTIEEYLSVNVQSDIVMTTVTSDWFGQELPIATSGTALVDVYTNIDATLRCPNQIDLTADGGAYTVDVQTALLGTGQNPVYLSGSYWCLDFTPGAYTGQTSVTASIKKTWTAADLADTYTVTITLELVPK